MRATRLDREPESHTDAEPKPRIGRHAWLWSPRLWLGVIALLLAIQITGRWYPTPDAVRYLSAGRSLAITGTLVSLGETPTGFPPGYSILIAPLFLISDRPFLLLSILNWALAVVFMIGLYRWLRSYTPTHALLLTALVMVNVNLWIQYHRPLKEMAFLAAAIWAVHHANQAIDARSGRARAIRVLLVSALIGCLVLLRESGIVFAMAFGLQLLFASRAAKLTRGWALVAFLAALAPAALLLGLSDRVHAGLPEGPQGEIGPVDRGVSLIVFGARTLGSNVRYRLDEIGRLVTPGMFSAYSEPGDWVNLHTVIYAAVFLLVAFGWWSLLRGGRRENLLLALPLYLALYLFWPVQQGTRFMLPMLPILQVAVWQCLGRFGGLRLPVLRTLLVTHLAIALGHWAFLEIPYSKACDAEWSNAEAVAAVIGPGDRVAVRRPAPDCLALSLAFLLDRRVARLEEGEAPPPGTRWLIVAKEEAGVTVFWKRRAIGPYYLLNTIR